MPKKSRSTSIPLCAARAAILFSLVPEADSRYEWPRARVPGPHVRLRGLFVDSSGIAYNGYWPGVIGRITELHGRYYHEHWNFGIRFETQVASELAEFLSRFRTGRDLFRTARAGAQFAGAVAIDGLGADRSGARLRWFIVEPSFQGKGVGRTLLAEAVEFCRTARYRRVFLWTFRGLDRARALYEANGFRLVEERESATWGPAITEQEFLLEFETGQAGR